MALLFPSHCLAPSRFNKVDFLNRELRDAFNQCNAAFEDIELNPAEQSAIFPAAVSDEMVATLQSLFTLGDMVRDVTARVTSDFAYTLNSGSVLLKVIPGRLGVSGNLSGKKGDNDMYMSDFAADYIAPVLQWLQRASEDTPLTAPEFSAIRDHIVLLEGLKISNQYHAKNEFVTKSIPIEYYAEGSKASWEGEPIPAKVITAFEETLRTFGAVLANDQVAVFTQNWDRSAPALQGFIQSVLSPEQYEDYRAKHGKAYSVVREIHAVTPAPERATAKSGAAYFA